MKRKLMKRKKKKGFTLIELLAVILILGIIALIAVPAVNSVVEQSRKGAANTSAQTFVEAIDKKAALANLNFEKIEDGDYSLADILAVGLEIGGDLPTDAIITIENNKVKDYQVIYDNYVVNSSMFSDEINVSKVDFESYVPAENNSYLGMLYYNPNEGKKCTKTDFEDNLEKYNTSVIGSDGKKFQDGMKSGCMIWYIYKDNGDGTVNMILNHNILSPNQYATNLTNMKNATSDWKNVPEYMKFTDLEYILELKKYLNFDTSKTYMIRTASNEYDYYLDLDTDKYFSSFSFDDLYKARNESNRYRYFWLFENSPFNLSYAKNYIPKVCKGMSGTFNVGYFLDGTINYNFNAQDGKKGYWTIGTALVKNDNSTNQYLLSNNGLVGLTNHAYPRPVITIDKSIYE